MRDWLGTPLIGLGFGFVLSRLGFASWDEVHRMFSLVDARLLLAFALSILLLGLVWWSVARLSRPKWTPRKPHPGTIPGGLVFGVGWSLTGACPSIALVQLGEGQLLAVWTVLGIFAGNYLYSMLHQRYLRWSTGSCLDD